MRLSGLEIRNFRSIGAEGVILNPLRKFNILIGQNNAGKSNVFTALLRISSRFQKDGKNVSLSDVDPHNRQLGTLFHCRLWFEADSSNKAESDLVRIERTSSH